MLTVTDLVVDLVVVLEPAALAFADANAHHAILLCELAQRIAGVGDRVRTRMTRLGELDAASQDVLIEFVRALEQRQLMPRVQLEAQGDARSSS